MYIKIPTITCWYVPYLQKQEPSKGNHPYIPTIITVLVSLYYTLNPFYYR